MGRWLAMILAAMLCGGCVQRTLTVRSDPPGALVYLNDEEVGRTPVTRNFLWYGTYEVEIRKEGYQTIKTEAKVWAPWWQWVPIDLVAELFPLTDRHQLSYTLHPPTDRQVDPQALIARGEALRGQLQSSQRPTTQPTTKPTPAARRKRST
jgi:PEGA domain-containing protein